MLLIGLSLAVSLALCVHAVRSGRELYWVFIILIIQPLGGLVYFFVVLLPELSGGKTARRVRSGVKERLDPERTYREATAALEGSPTVRNRMRLAEAASSLGRHDEAERLYDEAASGVHADDPALLLGRAQALVELGRSSDALSVLQRLGELGDRGRTPEAALAMARAYHAQGRMREAEDAYLWAVERLPRFEAQARYAAFLAEAGRRPEAEAILADLDSRLGRIDQGLRREARGWRDLAAAAVAR